MKSELKKIHQRETEHGSVRSYTLGFFICLGLTLLAFLLVGQQLLSNWALNVALVVLSIVQVTIQLIFFLHLGSEPKPQWNVFAFIGMATVVGILVLGTIWIMYNLEYRLMNM